MKKKTLGTMLSSVFIVSAIIALGSMNVMADQTAQGTCGENLNWTLDSDGTLTISGTGAMNEFSYHNTRIW